MSFSGRIPAKPKDVIHLKHSNVEDRVVVPIIHQTTVVLLQQNGNTGNQQNVVGIKPFLLAEPVRKDSKGLRLSCFRCMTSHRNIRLSSSIREQKQITAAYCSKRRNSIEFFAAINED